MRLPPLYILRHGQTEWNASGRLQGHQDSSLTGQGRHDAAVQGALLAPVLVRHGAALEVFASPQGRVRQTREIALAGLDLPVTEDARLMEAGAGIWEGLSEADIEARWPDEFAQHATRLSLALSAPGGESYEDVAARCRSFLAERQSPAVVFTHGATLAVMRGVARGLSYARTLELDHRQGVIYALEEGTETVLARQAEKSGNSV